jgi:NAD(P)-dependent dehydrogenase (short-subunit alcohol dehydrogenase family)
MGGLEGRVAVITGGSSGIGEATVRHFAGLGARVVVADIQDERGQALAEDLGSTVLYHHTDVTREEDVRAAVSRALEKWGRLDCMFNNAGFAGVVGMVDEVDMAGYDATMAVLLRGVFVGMKHAAAVMKQQRGGSIISTASIAGLQAGYSGPVYAAAKAAVVQLTRTVAVELGEFGIRVNCICPGITITNIFTAPFGLQGAAADALLPKLDAAFASWAPLGRSATADDIARAAAWLAGDESSYVTGHALVVDGGLTAGRSPNELRERLATAFGISLETLGELRRNAGTG